MMIAGPALVEQAGLGAVSKYELGHADIHTRNGAIDDAVDTEAEAFEKALQFLSYLPTSVDELPRLKIGAMTLLGAMSGSSMWCLEILDRATT